MPWMIDWEEYQMSRWKNKREKEILPCFLYLFSRRCASSSFRDPPMNDWPLILASTSSFTSDVHRSRLYEYIAKADHDITDCASYNLCFYLSSTKILHPHRPVTPDCSSLGIQLHAASRSCTLIEKLSDNRSSSILVSCWLGIFSLNEDR